jgi:UDP-N-acetyl-D-glucosamine dehydrogenase
VPVDLIVVGLGYVGMPLAQEAVRVGMSVAGYDVNQSVVDGVNAGRSHVDDLVDADIVKMLDAGFRAGSDETAFADAATIVVCVPTPLSEDAGPDLRAVSAAMAAIGRNLRAGALVVLESTTYPGTTDEVVRPILEQASGLTAGTDFHLAFSPERIDPGNPVFGMRNTPKVVGGLTPESSRRARDFYARFVDQVVVAKGLREAETAKLLENTYRHVNIALVNEMARFCHELDIDLWDVIRLASTKPFGFQAFYTGPGVGGHCIPIDPNYLSHRVRARLGYPFRFVELAQEINSGMPAYVAHRAQNLLNKDRIAMNGADVLLLGVTYKADIADQRESPALALAGQLQALGANVFYHDPHVPAWSAPNTTAVLGDVTEAVAKADVTILVQNHSVYDAEALAAAATRFLDTRGVTRADGVDRL